LQWLPHGQLTVLDTFIVCKDLEKKITFGDVGEHRSLAVAYAGLAHQPAVHVEKEQLVNLTILPIRRKEQHLLPGIGIEPDLVLLTALGLAHLDTVDCIRTRAEERILHAGRLVTGGKGSALNTEGEGHHGHTCPGV
jgi:hypothetical protein